jgi:hypothetical protein
MNLQKIKETLEQKEMKRTKLQGQKELKEKELSKLGYKSTEEALEAINKMKEKVKKLEVKAQEKTQTFLEKYKDLLND